MKKRLIYLLLFLSLCTLITACHSNDDDHTAEYSTESSNANTYRDNDASLSNEMVSHIGDLKADSSEPSADSNGENETDQMIIRQAQLEIKVNDLEKTQLTIEEKVNNYGGYVVESSTYRNDDEHTNAYMTIRVPEKHFQDFLTDAEGVAANVLERNITGQDVTEEYVDLTSRITSKRAVEKRLLSFLEKAEKTEDLLKISSDLADVQEEIEVIVGKMNYLENQADFATITITMHENQVVIPDVDNKDLNTWENTKKQLATSLNFLLATGSGFIVFFIGNLPIIILLSIIGIVIYTFIRRKVKE